MLTQKQLPAIVLQAGAESGGAFPGSFIYAAVAGYTRFPGTPGSFIYAAVAGYTRFPGTPAMVKSACRMG